MPTHGRIMPSKDCGDARSASVFVMLAQIRSFLTVVEEGNLHRAAARLRISQSRLSRQMQALEHELGGRLLERMAAGVSPIAHAFELIANENAVLILPAFATHHSPPGVVILPLVDAEVTWNILVMWRRGRAGGALKALLNALFTKVTSKAN
jgi:DNA-binding transcriptional LysR family regulator